MKKVFSLMFVAALALSLAMPVFGQDAAAPASSDSSMSAPKKAKKAKTAKPKKEKKAKKDAAAAPAQ